MNRREFCRLLALTAPGIVLAEQVVAAEQVYLLNSAHIPDGQLIAVREITAGFNSSPQDRTAIIDFFDGDTLHLPIAMNTRGKFRWRAPTPADAIMTSVTRFHWRSYERRDGWGDHGGPALTQELYGWVSWLDAEGCPRHTSLQGRSSLTEQTFMDHRIPQKVS